MLRFRFTESKPLKFQASEHLSVSYRFITAKKLLPFRDPSELSRTDLFRDRGFISKSKASRQTIEITPFTLISKHLVVGMSIKFEASLLKEVGSFFGLDLFPTKAKSIRLAGFRFSLNG